MLEEKKEENKSKRKEFEELVTGLQKMGWHYDTIALTEARRYEERKKEGIRRRLNEQLELTPEEITFKQADEEKSKLPQKEREEIDRNKKKSDSRQWYIIHTKEYINEIKEIYKLALAAQVELCNELRWEWDEREEKEWFKSLAPENRVQAGVAIRRQQDTFIKLQNEILQVWEDQIDNLHLMIKGISQ